MKLEPAVREAVGEAVKESIMPGNPNLAEWQRECCGLSGISACVKTLFWVLEEFEEGGDANARRD